MSAGTPPTIASREDFIAALHWGFEQAMAQQARQLLCIDPHFDDWPLGDPMLLDALSAWLRLPQRRLCFVAAGYEQVPARHPRFNDWRRYRSHAIDFLQAPEEMATGLPTLLLDDRVVCVQLIDAEHWRGRAEVDARTVRLWRDRVDGVLRRATPSFPVNVLGL